MVDFELDRMTIEVRGFRYVVERVRVFIGGVLVSEEVRVEETIILGYSP